jgi:hypothetical protein
MKPSNREFIHKFDRGLYPQVENIVRAKNIDGVGFQEMHDRVFL